MEDTFAHSYTITRRRDRHTTHIKHSIQTGQKIHSSTEMRKQFSYYFFFRCFFFSLKIYLHIQLNG